MLRNTWCRNLLKFGCAVRLVTTWEFLLRGCCDNQMVELIGATRSLCSATKLVSAGYSIEMRPTQSVLRRIGGGCMLLQRCGKRDFLSIRVRKSCEINAITFSTMRTGHLSTSEVRLPWTAEEKH